MSLFFGLVLFIILFIVLIIISILNSRAAANVADHSGYKSDHNLESAHSYLTWASILGWIGFGIICLIAILAVIGFFLSEGTEIFVLAPAITGIIYVFTILLAFLVFICGILSIAGTYNIFVSDDYKNNSDLETALYSAAEAVATAFISLILLLIGIYFMFVYRKQAKQEIKQEKKSKKTENTTSSGGFNTSDIATFFANNPQLVQSFL